MHTFHHGSRKDCKHWVSSDFVNTFGGKLRDEESGVTEAAK